VKKCGIIGLGNPGSHYAQTRHNIGFWILDEFAKQNDLTFSKNEKFGAETCKYFNKEGNKVPELFMKVNGLIKSNW